MSNIYRIEMMTKASYHEFMTGGYNYAVDYVNVEAETAELALDFAKRNYGEYIINEAYIPTVEELEAEAKKKQERQEAAHREAEEKKAKAKARKEEREKAKAEELGLTLEEYKAKVKHDKKIQLAEKEIKRLKIELAKAEKYLENLQKRY